MGMIQREKGLKSIKIYMVDGDPIIYKETKDIKLMFRYVGGSFTVFFLRMVIGKGEDTYLVNPKKEKLADAGFFAEEQSAFPAHSYSRIEYKWEDLEMDPINIKGKH